MKTALGRGLDALIPEGGSEVVQIELGRIRPGAAQPRKVFAEAPLKELAASIREKGVLQPVIVSRGSDGGYELVAGERRVRAAKLAGLKSVPAILRQTDAEDALEVAIIENIQREDLGPIETAEAFELLVKRHGYTQEKLAARVGKERATVANYLRLLKLPPEVKKFVNSGDLSMGHARAVLGATGRAAQVALAAKIRRDGLSVRQAEELAGGRPMPGRPKRVASAPSDPHVRDLQEKLIRSLGTKVRLRHKGKQGGSIEIQYYSLEELDRLLEVLL